MGTRNDRRDSVGRVLDGDLDYDELDADKDQAVVRRVWDERTAERIATLDLESEFRAQGRAWTEIDEDGNPVRRNPRPSGSLSVQTGRRGRREG